MSIRGTPWQQAEFFNKRASQWRKQREGDKKKMNLQVCIQVTAISARMLFFLAFFFLSWLARKDTAGLFEWVLLEFNSTERKTIKIAHKMF